MVIYWPNITLPRGTAYGYAVHIDGMARALRAAGVDLTEDPSAPADIAVTIATPNQFAPVPGKRNVLFTMAETDSVPPRFAEKLKGADLLVVPCSHNVAVFRAVYSGPIEVCPEGIDSERFPVHSRKVPAPGEPFRFLWCGSRTRARAPAFHVCVATVGAERPHAGWCATLHEDERLEFWSGGPGLRRHRGRAKPPRS